MHRLIRPAILLLTAALLSACATKPKPPVEGVYLPKKPVPGAEFIKLHGDRFEYGRLGESPEHPWEVTHTGIYFVRADALFLWNRYVPDWTRTIALEQKKYYSIWRTDDYITYLQGHKRPASVLYQQKTSAIAPADSKEVLLP